MACGPIIDRPGSSAMRNFTLIFDPICPCVARAYETQCMSESEVSSAPAETSRVAHKRVMDVLSKLIAYDKQRKQKTLRILLRRCLKN